VGDKVHQVVLVEAGRLMELPAQIPEAVGLALQGRALQVELLQGRLASAVEAAVERLQLVLTQRAQLRALVALDLILIRLGLPQPLLELLDITLAAVVEDVQMAFRLVVLVVLVAVVQALLVLLELLEPLIPEVVAVVEAKTHQEQFLTAALAVLEL
jgi:hypothetical protein